MQNVCRKIGWILGFSFTLAATAALAEDVPQGITYQGRILKPDGSALEAANVIFNFKIISPGAEACVLYEQNQTINMTDSGGLFSLVIGSSTGRVDSTGLTLSKIFSNAQSYSSLTCLVGSTYTPSASDSRKLRVSFNDGTQVVTLAQDLVIRSVPYALSAERLGGLDKTGYVQTSTALTQSKAEQLFQTDTFNNILGLINGGSSGSLALPSGTTAQRPSSPTDGYIRYNTTTQNLESYFNGAWSNVITGGGGGSFLSLSGGSMTGAIDMNGQNLTNTSYITMNPNVTLHLSNNASDPSGLAASDKGKMWFNTTSNKVKYWDGSSAVIVGASASALAADPADCSANTFAVGIAANGDLSCSSIDISTAAVAGVLPIARGGTNSSAALTNNKLMVSSGGAIVENANFTVASGGLTLTGSADTRQLTLKGHSTQTSNILEVQNSGGTAKFSVSNTGAVTAAGSVSSAGFASSAAGSITGSADAVQLGLIGNSTQTANVIEVRNSGNTLKYNIRGDYAVSDSTSFATKAYVDSATTSGNAATATALAANPADCASNTFATAIAANGDLSCSAIDISTAAVTGVLPIARGGTNSGTTLNNNKLMVSSSGAIVESSKIGTSGAALAVTGSTDEVQLSLKGHSTQTSNIFEVRNSSNSLLATINNSGDIEAKGSFIGIYGQVWRSAAGNSGNMNVYGAGDGYSYSQYLLGNTANSKNWSLQYRNGATVGAEAESLHFQYYDGSSYYTPIKISSSGNQTVLGRVTAAGLTSSAYTAITGSSDAVQLSVKGNSTQTSNIVEVNDSSNTNLLKVDNSGNTTVKGQLIVGVGTDTDTTLDFTSSSMIRTSASGACGTLNFTNLTSGGTYTVTMASATTTCSTIQMSGATTNVILPSGYPAGVAVTNGVVYTAIYDGSKLWVSYIPF